MWPLHRGGLGQRGSGGCLPPFSARARLWGRGCLQDSEPRALRRQPQRLALGTGSQRAVKSSACPRTGSFSDLPSCGDQASWQSRQLGTVSVPMLLTRTALHSLQGPRGPGSGHSGLGAGGSLGLPSRALRRGTWVWALGLALARASCSPSVAAFSEPLLCPVLSLGGPPTDPGPGCKAVGSEVVAVMPRRDAMSICRWED